MPKPWSQVAASPEYQALPPDQQSAAREQYFTQVVAPQISDPSQVQAAKSQFDQQTGGQSAAASGDLPTQTATPSADDYRNAGMSVPGKLRTPDETTFQKINDVGNDLGDAAMHHLGNLPIGIAQLVGHGITAGTNAVTGSPSPTLDATNTNFDAYAKQREAQYQQNVPTNVASTIGAGVGEVLPWLTGVGEARAAGLIPSATTKLGAAGLLAGEGATMGAAQPVTGDGSYAAQKAVQVGTGAVTAPLVYGAAKLPGAVSTTVRDALSHATGSQSAVDKQIANLYQPTPANISALRGTPKLVPGEVPSAAQALGGADAVQAERVLRTRAESAPNFVNQDAQNNAARQKVIANLAGDDTTLDAAVQARKAATQPFIDANLSPTNSAVRFGNAIKPIDDALSSPMVRDANWRALNDAKGVMQKVRSGDMQEDDALEALNHISATTTQGSKAFNALNNSMESINKNMVDPTSVLNSIATVRNGSLGTNPTVNGALGSIATQIKNSQNINGLVGTDLLDGIRQNARRILQANHNPASLVGSQEEAGIAPIKAQIQQTLAKALPGYSDYLAAYAKHSEPINTMQTVRALVDPNAPGSLNVAGDPQLAISRIRQVLRGDDKANYPMSDAARTQLEGVRDSLLRRGISDNKIGPAGSNTAADLQATGLSRLMFGSSLGAKGGAVPRAIGAAAGGLAGSTFGPVGTLAGAGIGSSLSDLAGLANSRLVGKVGQTAANASMTADALERELVRQNVPATKAKLVSQKISQLLLGTP